MACRTKHRLAQPAVLTMVAVLATSLLTPGGVLAQGAGAATPGGGPAPDGGIASRIRLRPIDRATVRILNIGGATPYAFEGRSGARRTVCLPDASHGTGVVLRGGIVLTAAHVVAGGDLVAVLPPGTDNPMAARVVYTDPARDISFLAVDGQLPHQIDVPAAARPLTLSERLSASGYPLDIRERFPAAVSGELSRENNDGSLQAAMSVNPGNSGGPVIDAEGHLVGILARRGEPTRGVEGIALLEPLRFIIPGYARAQAVVTARAPQFDQHASVYARIAADFVRTSDERPIFEQTAVTTLDEAAHPPSPEIGAMVAAHAWNMQIALLEARGVRERHQLVAADLALATRLNRTAVQLANWAVRAAPYLSVHYPGLRGIIVSGGRPFVPVSR